MTEEQVETMFQHYCAEIMSTRQAGQKEYAKLGNAFANFETLAKDLNLPREKILWVYAMKHKDGIANYLNGHTSQREDVRGRIKDLVVYLFLLWAMLDEKEKSDMLDDKSSYAQVNAPRDWRKEFGSEKPEVYGGDHKWECTSAAPGS